MIIKSKIVSNIIKLEESAVELIADFSFNKIHNKIIDLENKIDLVFHKKEYKEQTELITLKHNTKKYQFLLNINLFKKTKIPIELVNNKLINTNYINNKEQTKQIKLNIYNTNNQELNNNILLKQNKKEYLNNQYITLLKIKDKIQLANTKIEKLINNKISNPTELIYLTDFDIEIKNLAISIKQNIVTISFDKLEMFDEYELYYLENNEFVKIKDFYWKDKIIFNSDKKIFSIIPKGVLNG